MNPGEKAKQIIDKFLPLVEAFTEVGRLENAKKCALIAVDECLNTCVECSIYFWQEVKQEIEKL